ncbi:MAG TPA: hypothetical protein VMX94_11610 [Armatimonadota bacterium]|nr:hypothetical protein [Armatimonadota bacterium]
MLSRVGRVALSTIMLAAVVLGSATLSHRSFAGKEGMAPHKLTILFTGDDWGQVKPCG